MGHMHVIERKHKYTHIYIVYINLQLHCCFYCGLYVSVAALRVLLFFSLFSSAISLVYYIALARPYIQIYLGSYICIWCINVCLARL